jgi:hypothetical protein
MERLLGVSVGGHEQSISQEISSSSRNDVNEADELSRGASEHGERKRGLSRTFFEAVDEGQVSLQVCAPPNNSVVRPTFRTP